MRSRDVIFQEDQTLEDFDKIKWFKGTSDDLIELVPIPSLLTKKIRKKRLMSQLEILVKMKYLHES